MSSGRWGGGRIGIEGVKVIIVGAYIDDSVSPDGRGGIYLFCRLILPLEDGGGRRFGGGSDGLKSPQRV